MPMMSARVLLFSRSLQMFFSLFNLFQRRGKLGTLPRWPAGSIAAASLVFEGKTTL